MSFGRFRQTEGLELNGTHQHLLYADDSNILVIILKLIIKKWAGGMARIDLG